MVRLRKPNNHRFRDKPPNQRKAVTEGPPGHRFACPTLGCAKSKELASWVGGTCGRFCSAQAGRSFGPKAQQFAQRRAQPWYSGGTPNKCFAVSCRDRPNGPRVRLISRSFQIDQGRLGLRMNFWPVGPIARVNISELARPLYQGCALRWANRRPFGACRPSLSAEREKNKLPAYRQVTFAQASPTLRLCDHHILIQTDSPLSASPRNRGPPPIAWQAVWSLPCRWSASR